MTSRQQRRAQERAEKTICDRITAFRRANPLAEKTYKQGYDQGWHDACGFAIKTCYAAAILALHELEGYGARRNTRFLQKMDSFVTNTLTSGEIIEEALAKAGVQLDFRETFPEDRIQEV